MTSKSIVVMSGLLLVATVCIFAADLKDRNDRKLSAHLMFAALLNKINCSYQLDLTEFDRGNILHLLDRELLAGKLVVSGKIPTDHEFFLAVLEIDTGEMIAHYVWQGGSRLFRLTPSSVMQQEPSEAEILSNAIPLIVVEVNPPLSGRRP